MLSFLSNQLAPLIQNDDLEKFQECYKKDPDSVKNCRWALDQTAVHLAARFGSAKIMTYLLENEFDVDARTSATRRTPLQIAALYGQANMVTLLLNCGAAVNAVDSSNNTALHLAHESKKNDCVDSEGVTIFQRLQSRGADLYAKNGKGISGQTILFCQGSNILTPAFNQQVADETNVPRRRRVPLRTTPSVEQPMISRQLAKK